MGSSFVLLLVCILLAFCGGAEGPLVEVGRLLGIAADLGEVTSVAAGQAINVTGAIAHAVQRPMASILLRTSGVVWMSVSLKFIAVLAY